MGDFMEYERPNDRADGRLPLRSIGLHDIQQVAELEEDGIMVSVSSTSPIALTTDGREDAQFWLESFSKVVPPGMDLVLLRKPSSSLIRDKQAQNSSMGAADQRVD